MLKSMHTILKFCHSARVIKLILMVVISVIPIAQSAGWLTHAQSLPADAQPKCTVTTGGAPAFASWFESGAVTLNGVVKPANSVNFPDIPNCSFHQWSWQMFLWLTSPAPPSYGGGGGRIFDSPAFYDVSPPDASGKRTFIPHTPGVIRGFNLRAAQLGPNRLPVILDKRGRMFEVEPPQLAANGRQLIRSGTQQIEIANTRITNNKPVFLDKTNKVIASPRAITRVAVPNAAIVQRFVIEGRPVFLDTSGNVIDVEAGQAGLPGENIHQALLAQNGSLVFYTTTVNDVFAYFLTGTKNGGITPAPMKFPTTQAELNKITGFAATRGKTFPDPEALAIEIKSAWVEAAGLPNLSSYITTQATIPTYNKTDPKHWVPNGQKTTQLALVGMHVVGSTKGHPEMIWATFEHFGNTPNAAYQYLSTTQAAPKTAPQNTLETWLFSASGATDPFNEPHLKADGANLTALGAFTISPSNTRRKNAWGNPDGTDLATATKNTEVIAINNSVLGMLPNGDVRKNYMLTGATWTKFGASPNAVNQVGTNQMANTAMETYQQGHNCFECHTSNTTAVSHVFGPLQPLFAGGTAGAMYASTIQPIWNAQCINCHNGGGAGLPQVLNLMTGNSYGQLFNVNAIQLPSMRRIKANDVANSYLVHKIEGTQVTVGGTGERMPFGCSGTACLTAAQINDIKAWINAGAPPP